MGQEPELQRAGAPDPAWAGVFELTIFRGHASGYPVRATWRGADGLPRVAEGSLTLDRASLLAADLDRRRYGTVLGEALFCGMIRDAFEQALAQSAEHLRVLLTIEDPELRRLHWERLCAPLDGDWIHLAHVQRLPFSRYLPSFADRRFPPIGRRDLRALILAASPAGLSRYGLEPVAVSAAVAGIQAALAARGIPVMLLADLPEASGPPTIDHLCEQLIAEPATLLHIICHGRVVADGETVLFLAHAAYPQEVDPVTATELIDRLRTLRGARGLPQCAFLAGCATASEADGDLGGLAQRLVRELGMPAVVAMPGRVDVADATALAGCFYDRLYEHGHIDLALAEATAGLAVRDRILIPALFSRLGERPLFADTLERPLTPDEIAHGLGRLAEELPRRAPVLQKQLEALEAQLDAAPEEGLSREAHGERAAALRAADALCLEALDLSFPALALGAPLPPYDERCPFPGLAAFATADSAFFFGRAALVSRLVARLDAYPFLAVLGPSGSGKSSLILAGLVPTLQERRPGLVPVVLTPGAAPLERLDAALAQAGGGPALVVVDQFEELFTLCADVRQRQAFVDRLLALADQPVVITMRADFVGDCTRYPRLRDAIQYRQELIGPMSPYELRQAVGQQAATVGLRLEEALIDQLFADLSAEPGAMPLLQHALLVLWRRRRGRWLCTAEYTAIGRIQGAIAQTAEAIYRRLDLADQGRMRDIFLRLTRPERDATVETARGIRRRVPLADLVPDGQGPDATRELVRRFAGVRLLVTGGSDDDVEVAHEALIRAWPRLRDWLDEDREALRAREWLRQAVQDWERNGRDERGINYGDLRIQQVESLVARSQFEPDEQERAYLAACNTLAERERDREAAERRRELEQALKLAKAEREQAGLQASAARRELDHAQKLAEAERETAVIEARAAQRLRRRARALALALAAALIVLTALVAALLIALQA